MPTNAAAWLAQASPRGEQEQAALIVMYVVVAIVAATLAWGGLWLRRDAARRSRHVAGWLLTWSAMPGLATVIWLLLITTGRPLEAAVTWMTMTVLSMVAFLVLWTALRPHTLIYDAQGKPIHPRAITEGATGFVFGAPPPRGPPPAGAAAAGPAVVARHTRCPRCHTEFPYVPWTAGISAVRCPSCGLTGTV